MKSLKSLKNAYSDDKTKGKKYLRVLFVLLVCSFLGCNVQNNELVDEKKNNKMTILTDQSYVMQELYVSRDSQQIYGELYMPRYIDKKVPIIIYCHGLGGYHEDGVQYAKELAKLGYGAYCFDFCGGSPLSRSDGSTLEMSIFTEQKDLEAVIKMIQELDFVDKDNIFLLGSSQGGVVSAITAAKNPEIIRGMMLLYPAFVLVDQAQALFKSIDDIPDNYYHLWMSVGKGYFEKLLNYDVYDEISSYNNDVLIIHGDADSIVPLSYSKKAENIYLSAQLKVIEGAGHGFYDYNFKEAMSYIKNYLVENIYVEDNY